MCEGRFEPCIFPVLAGEYGLKRGADAIDLDLREKAAELRIVSDAITGEVYQLKPVPRS